MNLRRTSSTMKWFRNKIAALSFFVLCGALAGEQRAWLGITVNGPVATISVFCPAKNVVVVQFATKPDAHDNNWYAVAEFPAFTNDRTEEYSVPAVGSSLFFRTFQYQIEP